MFKLPNNAFSPFGYVWPYINIRWTLFVSFLTADYFHFQIRQLAKESGPGIWKEQRKVWVLKGTERFDLICTSKDGMSKSSSSAHVCWKLLIHFFLFQWGSQAFKNMRIVPPGSGIIHQVNLEYLARVVMDQDGYYYPDSVVGTDSHTTMIDGLGVLGWGMCSSSSWIVRWVIKLFFRLLWFDLSW